MFHVNHRNLIINYFTELSPLNHSIIKVQRRSQQDTAHGINSGIPPNVENKVLLEHSPSFVYIFFIAAFIQ